MLTEAAQFIRQAHEQGMISVVWMYPRGKAVPNEKDPQLIAGAAGVAGCLGADFAKVNYPDAWEGMTQPESFKIAVEAAGRTGIICSGGGSLPTRIFATLSTTKSTLLDVAALQPGETFTRSLRILLFE